MNGSDKWEWVKNDGGATLMIPEAPFPMAEESYERQLRYWDEAVPEFPIAQL
jgi:hypothetical protein